MHYQYECQEQSDGKSIALVFNEGLQELLKEALETRNVEQYALSMEHGVKVIWKEMFDK